MAEITALSALEKARFSRAYGDAHRFKNDPFQLLAE
jgi:hypothetical protein